MRFKKGQSGNPEGRKKGSTNKITADLKDMIIGALNAVGGVAYLADQARENPKVFMTLLGKVLPMSVVSDEGAPLVSKVTVEIVAGEKNGDQDPDTAGV